MVFISMQAAPPSPRHLRHWEAVCRYLDAQPYRAVSYPFPTDPPLSVRLLKRMARYRLVRHRDDCRWQLSLRWQVILLRLWRVAPTDEAPAEQLLVGAAAPFIADTGVDTLYVNLLAEQLPRLLIQACDTLKRQAQEDDQTVETPWLLFGAPLSMYKAGVGTREKGRGVSWSYILRNAMAMLLLRKAPLAGLVGSVRLSAECLWTHGPRGSLDRLRSDLATMWGRAELGSFRRVTWQLSQIHLCADVAHWAPEPEHLTRLLTRSRKKAVHLPASADAELAFAGVPDDGVALDDAWLAGMLPPDWEGLPPDLLDSALVPDADEADASTDAEEDKEGDDDLHQADEQGAVVHLWGQRASGFAFSPGADLSAVWYDKLLEERLSGKRWMEAIHEAGGWRPGMPLTRVEVRLRRGVLRELMAHARAAHEGEGARWFDDPWECLDHLQDLWSYFAGLPPEADTAPDVTHRGWMRLVMSEGQDTNHSRWRTDPVWELLQQARFDVDAAPLALTRAPRVRHDLELVDAELYGLLKLLAALRGEYLDTTATLSQELQAFAVRMDAVDAERGRDFAEEVREKARLLGKPVPMRETSVLQLVQRPASGRPGGGP